MFILKQSPSSTFLEFDFMISHNITSKKNIKKNVGDPVAILLLFSVIRESDLFSATSFMKFD